MPQQSVPLIYAPNLLPQSAILQGTMSELLPSTYPAFADDLKARIRAAQVKASLSVNRELILLYWQIGRDLVTRRQSEGWGAKVVERLSQDLHVTFPEMKGLSVRNLVYMQTLAQAYPDEAFTQQAVALIPWGHNVVILDKLHTAEEREWYVHQTLQHGWSRNVLVLQIESRLLERQGKAPDQF